MVEEEDGDCVVDFKWVSVSAIVSAGDEGIDTDDKLRKRFADGENTGEFDTATEHDIVFLFPFVWCLIWFLKTLGFCCSFCCFCDFWFDFVSLFLFPFSFHRDGYL